MTARYIYPAEIDDFVKSLTGRRARLSLASQTLSLRYDQVGVIGEVVVATGPCPPDVPREKGVRVSDSELIRYDQGPQPHITPQGDNVWGLPNVGAVMEDGMLKWYVGGTNPGVLDRIDYCLKAEN